jgi:Co/Zn/Cd efflux system component
MQVAHEGLLYVSIASFAVNLIGLVTLRPSGKSKHGDGRAQSLRGGVPSYGTGLGTPPPGRHSLGRPRRFNGASPPVARKSDTGSPRTVMGGNGHSVPSSPGVLASAETRSNLIGEHRTRSASGSSASSSSGRDVTPPTTTLHDAYLHVTAGAMGSLGAILSATLVEYVGWHVVDAASGIFIALLILGSVGPLLQTVTPRTAPSFLMPSHALPHRGILFQIQL